MHSHSPSWFILSLKATADIGAAALITAVIFTFVATVTVVLRWYSRTVLSRKVIGASDFLVTAALMLSMGFVGIVGTEYGLKNARSTDEAARMTALSKMLKLVFTQSLLYHLAINLVRVSFLLQYMRLFSIIRPVAYICYILLAFVVGSAAYGTFGVIFLCRPVQRYWDASLPGMCNDAEIHFWATSIVGIVLDWAIWLLPMPVVGRLSLPRRQKLGLLAVFGLGGFVCIVGVLRLVLVHDAAHHDKVTRSGTFALIWSTIEINVAITCASLLFMKPLFARFIPALVTEQPVSAREDARLWRTATGQSILENGLVREEKSEHEGAASMERRDTATESQVGDGKRSQEAEMGSGTKRHDSWTVGSRSNSV